MVQLFNYFKCGNISKNKTGMTVYLVQDIESLHNIILPHFSKYPLQGTKQQDFLNFKAAVETIYAKSHLTEIGFQKVMLNYQQMNTKREKNLLTIDQWRNLDIKILPLNGHYINGFLAGDGSLILLTNLNNMETFGKIIVSFTQHLENYILMASVLRYFSPKLNPSKQSVSSVVGSVGGLKY